MEMNAPITLEMKVCAQSEEDNTNAVLSLSLPRGVLLTREQLKKYVDDAEKQLPDGYVLMNKSEFFNALLVEEYGPQLDTFATPGSCEFVDDVVEVEFNE